MNSKEYTKFKKENKRLYKDAFKKADGAYSVAQRRLLAEEEVCRNLQVIYDSFQIDPPPNFEEKFFPSDISQGGIGIEAPPMCGGFLFTLMVHQGFGGNNIDIRDERTSSEYIPSPLNIPSRVEYCWRQRRITNYELNRYLESDESPNEPLMSEGRSLVDWEECRDYVGLWDDDLLTKMSHNVPHVEEGVSLIFYRNPYERFIHTFFEYVIEGSYERTNLHYNTVTKFIKENGVDVDLFLEKGLYEGDCFAQHPLFAPQAKFLPGTVNDYDYAVEYKMLPQIAKHGIIKGNGKEDWVLNVPFKKEIFIPYGHPPCPFTGAVGPFELSRPQKRLIEKIYQEDFEAGFGEVK